LDSLRAFFHPLPLWLVVLFVLFTIGFGVLVNLPHQWADQAMRVLQRLLKAEKR
jgi:hypothetical protein